MSQRISLLLPYYFADSKFPELFEGMGFDVFCSGGPELKGRIIETEDYVSRQQPDLALEWQRGPDDFPIHDLLKKYDRQTPVFLILNWNGRLPTDLQKIDYAGYLPLPLKPEEFISQFYTALPGGKRKVFENMLTAHCPNLFDFENDLLDVFFTEGIIVILNQIKVPGQSEIDVLARILLVDDETAVTDSLKAFLEENTNYTSYSVNNGEAAREFLAEHFVDLVVTDVYHPGMNGLELTKYIKKNFDSDVIILTGYRETKFDDAISAGASDFFYKPALLKELLVSIKRIIQKRTSKNVA
jgi:CheY-like chemotaxis protein